MLGGLAASLAAPLVRVRAAETAPLGFVALGDWGKGGDATQRAVAEAMGRTAEEIGSRFVLSAGDNFYPAGVSSVHDPQWVSSFEDVYTAPSLQTPWFVALGNHDYRGRPHAQVAYSSLSTRWRMPSRYFKLGTAETGAADLEIFVIDTTPLAPSIDETAQQALHGHLHRRHAERQLAWLRRELERSTAPWKLVVGHHPICSGAHGDTRELVEHVQPLLEANGVQAYINGHDHDLQHIRRGKVDYICSGAGAAAGHVVPVAGTAFCASRPGFAAFTLAGDMLSFEFRDQAGEALYRAAIPRSRA